MHDPNTTVFGHSLQDLDEDDELITSTSLADLLPSSRDSAKAHIDSFRERYATYRQAHDLPPNDSIKSKRDMQQQIDFAVVRALEKHPLLATTPTQRGHGFGTPGASASDSRARDRSDNELLLAEAIAAVEKLTSRETTPSKDKLSSSLLDSATLQPPPKPPDIVTSTPTQTVLGVTQARPTATLAPFDKDNEHFEKFLARFDNFATYFKWTESDKLFHLRNSLPSKTGNILWDGGKYNTVPELITLLQNRFGSSNQTERYRMELNARRRGPKEILQSLYLDIKRLLALAHKNASEETLDSIGIDKFVNAFGNSELRRSVLQQNCKTLDDALNVAVRMEAIDISTPIDVVMTFNADGSRIERANVRGVSSEDPSQWHYSDTSSQRSDLPYWQSQPASQAYRQPPPSQMGDGMSSISGLSTSASYQAPQQFRQQFAPTQGSTIQPQFNSFNQQNNDFQPRGTGQHTPRAQKQCYNCGTQGHTKRYCPCLTPYLQAWYAANPPKSSNQGQQPRQPQNNSNQGNAQGNPTADYPTQGNPTAGYPTQGNPTAGYPTSGYQTNPHRQMTQQHASIVGTNLCSSMSNTENQQSRSPSPSTYDLDNDQIPQLYARGVTFRSLNPIIYVRIQIGDTKHHCIIDSGCDYSLAPHRLLPTANLHQTNIEAFAVNGSPISTLGTADILFTIEGILIQEKFLISDQVKDFILGYNWLATNSIIWNFSEGHILLRNKQVTLLQQPTAVSVNRVITKSILHDKRSIRSQASTRHVHFENSTDSTEYDAATEINPETPPRTARASHSKRWKTYCRTIKL